MLVTIAFVKFVGALANYIGTDRHALATVLARPIFGGGQQLGASSQVALPFGDDQPVHFRPDLHLQQRLLAHMQRADHSMFRSVRDEYGMQRGRLDSQQPLANLCCRRRVSELGGKHGNPRRIGALRSPDLQLFGLATLRRFVHAVFRWSRFCTAALFNSRSASAAIQRAARELCERILSAAQIASRLSRIFLFPIFRKAQLTAFFTKFRSSYASRSTTLKNRTNRASGATSSL